MRGLIAVFLVWLGLGGGVSADEGRATAKSALEALGRDRGEAFRANVVDSTLNSFVFEITGTSDKIDAFADLMRPLGLAEIARTGVAALLRGDGGHRGRLLAIQV